MTKIKIIKIKNKKAIRKVIKNKEENYNILKKTSKSKFMMIFNLIISSNSQMKTLNLMNNRYKMLLIGSFLRVVIKDSNT